MEIILLLLILKMPERKSTYEVKLLNSVSKSLVGFLTDFSKSSYEKIIAVIFDT